MSPYSSAPHGYSYSYGHPASAATTHQQGHYAPQHLGHHMPLPPTMPSNQQQNPGPVANYSTHTPDTTGQVAPPNHKPKLTGTVWEDEGTVCFQVEVKGICVARREDNCFINGTKLLNVANMTRGRRDGILKSEKVRNVIKIGPMHLKGVWIPFDRALDFANKEKITEQLYPLFVNNISPLLAPHFNQTLQSGRRTENTQPGQPAQLKTPQAQTDQPPSSAQHQSGDGEAQVQHVVDPHQSAGRPAGDRTHNFPTPPTSATSGTVQAANNYAWEANGLPSSHALQAEAGMQSAKSIPATPLTSPPPDSAQTMHYPTSQSYDTSRAVYSAAPSQQTSYSGSMYGQMQPPRKREEDGEENKDYGQTYGSEYPSYHDSHQQISPDIKTSSHPASGRGTPRNIISPGTHWQNGSYAAASRAVPASNLAYVGADASHQNGYGAPAAYTNGHVSSINKRSRDVEDDDPYIPTDPSMKKRKSIREDSAGMGHARAAIVQRQ